MKEIPLYGGPSLQAAKANPATPGGGGAREHAAGGGGWVVPFTKPKRVFRGALKRFPGFLISGRCNGRR